LGAKVEIKDVRCYCGCDDGINAANHCYWMW